MDSLSENRLFWGLFLSLSCVVYIWLLVSFAPALASPLVDHCSAWSCSSVHPLRIPNCLAQKLGPSPWLSTFFCTILTHLEVCFTPSNMALDFQPGAPDPDSSFTLSLCFCDSVVSCSFFCLVADDPSSLCWPATRRPPLVTWFSHSRKLIRSWKMCAKSARYPFDNNDCAPHPFRSARLVKLRFVLLTWLKGLLLLRNHYTDHLGPAHHYHQPAFIHSVCPCCIPGFVQRSLTTEQYDWQALFSEQQGYQLLLQPCSLPCPHHTSDLYPKWVPHEEE